MSDKFLLREQTKRDVRALLMSSPVELTVDEFKRDYSTFVGKTIDYRGMGYSTLEDFLRLTRFSNKTSKIFCIIVVVLSI